LRAGLVLGIVDGRRMQLLPRRVWRLRGLVQKGSCHGHLGEDCLRLPNLEHEVGRRILKAVFG